MLISYRGSTSPAWGLTYCSPEIWTRATQTECRSEDGAEVIERFPCLTVIVHLDPHTYYLGSWSRSSGFRKYTLKIVYCVQRAKRRFFQAPVRVCSTDIGEVVCKPKTSTAITHGPKKVFLPMVDTLFSVTHISTQPSVRGFISSIRQCGFERGSSRGVHTLYEVLSIFSVLLGTVTLSNSYRQFHSI